MRWGEGICWSDDGIGQRRIVSHTFAQHFVKCQYVPFTYLSACSSALADPGTGISYMTCTFARSTLISDGVAQWDGSLGSVLQISVTLAIMSLV